MVEKRENLHFGFDECDEKMLQLAFRGRGWRPRRRGNPNFPLRHPADYRPQTSG